MEAFSGEGITQNYNQAVKRLLIWCSNLPLKVISLNMLKYKYKVKKTASLQRRLLLHWILTVKSSTNVDTDALIEMRLAVSHSEVPSVPSVR